jgi:hypothetical protein
MPTDTPTATATNAPAPEQYQGCTPGYWKQPQHLDSWLPTGYKPDQSLDSVFDMPDVFGLDDATLLEALSFQGGSNYTGAAKTLLRASVSALLNSAHPEVAYPRTTSEVVSDVNAALASGDRSIMLTLAAELDKDNNLGCPLD